MLSMVFAALALPAVLAQALPDGTTVMKQVQEQADARQSIQYVFGISGEATNESGQKMAAPPVVSGGASLTIANPGKLRVDIGTMSRISDGATTWIYDSATKQYTKTSAGQRISILGVVPLDWFSRVAPPISELEETPKTIRQETIETDGMNHECWVLQDEFKIPDAFRAIYAKASLTSWIDKDSKIALKHEVSLSMATSPVILKFTLTARLFKIDEAIPADKFTFTPPQDSREVPLDASRLNLTGTTAPPFEARDLEGKSYSLDSLKGKPVLLDFWTTWCGPCAESAPALEKINTEFKDKGLVMLAVDVDETRKIVEAFLKPRPIHYPVIMGTEFGVAHAFQVNSFPTFIAISPDGKVVVHESGYSETGGEDRLRALVQKAFNTPTAAPENVVVNVTRPPNPGTIGYSPSAVTVDAHGNLYVTDSPGARILKVTPAGVASVVAGNSAQGFAGDGGPAVLASLNQPSAIAVDNSGNLYIADNGNNRIRKVTPGGIISSVDISRLQRIGGIVADADGNLYVSETTMHRVRKLSPEGTVTTVAGTGTPGSIGDGGPAASAQLALPNGLALDAAGNLYIADTGNHRVRKVAPDGIILLVAGNGSAGFSGDGSFAIFAQLRNPAGVAVDAAGNVYIADLTANRIRKVTTSGTISTIAGTGTAGFSGDGGPAQQAQLGAAVSSLATDGSGNLYLADATNERVRKISPDGTIATTPGTAPAPKNVGDSPK
jgi:thiol-disulfide isomerase/thioredoxin/sugar lactone lactonase YvrE/outer membrane lipoprotein-sorting protein